METLLWLLPTFSPPPKSFSEAASSSKRGMALRAGSPVMVSRTDTRLFQRIGARTFCAEVAKTTTPELGSLISIRVHEASFPCLTSIHACSANRVYHSMLSGSRTVLTTTMKFSWSVRRVGLGPTQESVKNEKISRAHDCKNVMRPGYQTPCKALP